MLQTDAVVIGAGFAGLSAALALRDAGLEVLVLEANNRVGGRVEAPANGLGERADTGGQFFCEDMPAITKLARSLGKTFVEPYTQGRTVARPPLPQGRSTEHLWRSVGALRERMNALDPADPSLREVTVANWVQGQAEDADTKASFLSLVNGLWCVDPQKLPLPFLISNDRRVTNEVTELQYFLRETMASVAEDLGERLGTALRLGEPVLAIERNGTGVSVQTKSEAIQARMAVVAVPPVRTRNIRFAPELPARLSGALAAWGSGAAAKVVLRYSQPFWRGKGLSGTVTSRQPPGLYACEASVDAQHPAIILFVAGPTLLHWRTEGEEGLRARAVKHLSDSLGAEAMQPLAVAVRDWTDDRWSGGAYGDVILDPNALDAEDVLREGWGPVQFASSELASSFPAYVEGAVVAGREAAARVLAACDGSQ